MSNICLMFVYNLFLRVGAIYSKTKQKKCGIGNSKKKKSESIETIYSCMSFAMMKVIVDHIFRPAVFLV